MQRLVIPAEEGTCLQRISVRVGAEQLLEADRVLDVGACMQPAQRSCRPQHAD